MTPKPGNGAGSALRPVRILSVGANAYLCVRFLGPVRGMLTHWHRSRTVPCAGQAVCPAAVHRDRTLWKGYAAAELWEDAAAAWVAVVVEVTESLELSLRGRTLRGEMWGLSHPQPTKKTTPVVGLYLESFDPDTLRPAFDVSPILCRFYHVPNLPPDTPNPVPPKVMLPPVPGDRPIFLGELPPPAERPATPEQRAEWSEQWKKLGFGFGRMPNRKTRE